MATEARPSRSPLRGDWSPLDDDPLRKATPSVDDVEARRAKAAIEGRLFSGPQRRVKVGRYRVLGRIGAGGMGVVYKAHDPELARDVAVKLMNGDAVADTEADHARGRLVREARAMARLAHPNVIHVYDVGTVEDGVFIAMELVEGESLGAWIRSAPRPWKDVLAKFLEAGRGLAAAHDAGVIHRDFKPENVLVGADGRVRVGDFGLAGGPGSETGRHEPASAADSGQAQIDRSAVAEALTRTGALLGTPKYMAPEQEAGLPATARSDQFSFCVALYEALFGQAPYAGDSVIEYRLEVREGKVRTPPEGSEVPGWIMEVLVKGLAIDAADRHGSMNELLDRLSEALVEPVPAETTRRKRPIVWVGALAVIVGFAVALGFALGQPPVEGPQVVALDVSSPPNKPEPAIPAASPIRTEAKAATKVEPEPEPEAEATPPVEEPKHSHAPRRTTAKGTKRGNGVACIFDVNNRFVEQRGRLNGKSFKTRTGACYYACFVPGNAPNLTAPENTDCKKYKCELDETGAACKS